MSKHLTFKTLAPTRKSDLSLLSDDWIRTHAKAPDQDPNRKKRAVIYPRYSSSLQDENSIERQIEVCSKYLDRIGAELVEPGDRFADRERSGAFMVGRDGLNELLVGVVQGLYDIIAVEDADRISRDLGHLGGIFATIEHNGAELHASMLGRPLGLGDIAMYGFLSAEQRKVLKARTRGGCIQAARQGRAPKGRIYGYATAPQGQGFLTIDKDQAAIVLLIYTMCDEGVSVRAIVRYLNSKGLPSPYGKKWSKAGILGILTNNRYKGVFIYNRTETRRHPDTGKRLLVDRPKEEWVVVAVPEWLIVDEELWARVQKRLAQRSVGSSASTGSTAKVVRASRAHEPMFPGQIYCTCGSRMGVVVKHAVQGKRLQCSDNMEKGSCEIGHSVGLAYVERNLLRMLRDSILCDETVMAYEAEYISACVRVRDEIAVKRTALATEIAKLDADIERTWDQKAMAGFSRERIASRRIKDEAELKAKRDELRSLPRIDSIPQPNPERAADLRGAITDLIDRIPSPLATKEDIVLAARISALVSRIELEFVPGGRGYTLRVEGSLNGLLEASRRDQSMVPVPRVVEATFGPTEWGRMADPDKRAKLIASAESGEHGLKFADWCLVEHVFEGLDLRAVNARDVLDAALFHLRTKVPISKLPACYGNFGTVRGALMRIVKAGLWDRAIEILRAADADSVRGIEPTVFDRWREAA